MSFQGLFESAKQRKKQKVQKNTAIQSHPVATQSSKNERQDNKTPPAAASSAKKFRSHHSSDRKRKRQFVSQEALALSVQLKNLSRQKRLDQVLELYWNAKDCDAHHACMVIDCCARCGHVTQAERVFEHATNNQPPNVEMHTALLKAFAHAGQVAKAEALFIRMCQSQSRVTPNVRTLNTLLRGCLWTAACLHEETVVGGVVTSEKAWKLYRDKVGEESLDASSYEYSISLLCQALRVQEATERIEEFTSRNHIHVKGKASFRGGDQTSLETLALVYLALAKAYGLLGRWDETWMACQRVLNAVEGSRALLDSRTTHVEVKGNSRGATGGKKSWNTKGDGAAQRLASNSSFRSHRLLELEMEARTILKLRSSCPTSKDTVAKRLATRLLYYSGGGTTELDGIDIKHDAGIDRYVQQRKLLVPVWYSFGAASLLNQVSEEIVRPDAVPDPKIVYKSLGLDKAAKKILSKDGRIDLGYLFSESARPIDLELGCGYGEWIANQAQNISDRNYIAVELRADRVSQIFIKTALLLRLDNVCVVGSDSERFLRTNVLGGRISNVYVNHPEPPTQTFGDSASDLNSIMAGGSEPAHMLGSSTLSAVAEALKPGGKIIIISDNRWYSRLICATVAKANRMKLCSLKPPMPSEAREMGLVLEETFSGGATLYCRTNNGDGATWFDRLWQTGAGRHAERTTRYAIVLTKH